MLNETTITRAIISSYLAKLDAALELDVAIVGAGPSGLIAGYFLARAGKKVALFERKLSMGGGMLGGGMMFNRIVVQDEALHIMDELGIRSVSHAPGYHTVDAVEACGCITYRAVQAGLSVFNCIMAEDVVYRHERVGGLVINWSPVESARLHVDPMTLHARYVLDATGHGADVVSRLVRKMGVRLLTETGAMMGEKSMDAELGERHTVENTREAFPGLFVSGMAANAVFGGYRMGPVFGGMFLSGLKAAQELTARLDT
ncbi:MAG TPA: sulfide-dependent adenosine diphosphate thiazole synthase [Deltaproteobacteria bacterium]|nr:sulfide-dependent adenosine diphosphate thiazole synthase [Deltaproteobacteria bacterium]